MTLFTAEGLLRAARGRIRAGTPRTRRVVGHAYQRWLHTQGEDPAARAVADGWLIREQGCTPPRARRPRASPRCAPRDRTASARVNDCKGCGGVMRVAPAGLLLTRHDRRRRPIGARHQAGRGARRAHARPPDRPARRRRARRAGRAAGARGAAARCARPRQAVLVAVPATRKRWRPSPRPKARRARARRTRRAPGRRLGRRGSGGDGVYCALATTEFEAASGSR